MRPVPTLRQARRRRTVRHASPGFTLIELMMTLVILAIIGAIAMPLYQSYVSGARRADARFALLDLAARQARFMALHGRYSERAQELGYAASARARGFPLDREWYRIRVSVQPGGSGFEAAAAPLGAQRGDACGTYRLDHLGTQRNTGNTLPSAACW
ncbi:hypothetical protein DFLDMN_005443 [Cupriavidus sp. H19C3]|uniref:type IV pilin protein n=1 Tax=Cupriavidus sp. H19C3 TaxID=3241603 RepID=UPI003BF7B3F8